MKISAPKQDRFLPKLDLKNPREISESEMRKFYTAICTGRWTPTADGRPAWAFKALSEFCRCCYMGPIGYVGLQPDPPKLPTLCRKMEIIRVNSDNQILLTFKNQKAFEDFFHFFCGKMVPLKLPAPDALNGFSPSQTGRAYLMIFLTWQVVQKRKTVQAIHNWLAQMLAMSRGEDYPRNTYNLLKRIGFPLIDKGGRPVSKNPEGTSPNQTS